MQAASKDTPTPKLMYLLVVFSSLLASSLAVSSEDKKWLLNTLLSLREDVRSGVLPPAISPAQWELPDPNPLPTPTHWEHPAENFESPSAASDVVPSDQSGGNKRKRGRITPYQLLCCNVPPTRPPSTKRPRYNPGDSRIRRLFLNALKNRSRSQNPSSRSQFVDHSEDGERPFYTLYDSADQGSQVVSAQRRGGVTVVKGGVSGINTG